MGLTLKQRLFLEQYKICKNGTQAARLVGYSQKSASRTAVRLLESAKIKQEVDNWEKEEIERIQSHRTKISHEYYDHEIWTRYQGCVKDDLRHKFLDLYGRSRGFLKADGDTQPSVSINFIGSELSFHLPGKEAKTEPAQLITAKISDNSHAKKHN